MSKVDHAQALRGLENKMQSMREPIEDHHKTLLNAANEIDRLRAENAELRKYKEQEQDDDE